MPPFLIIFQDLEEIGIDSKGFRLRLENAAKRLPSLRVYTEVPVSSQLSLHLYNQVD